MKLYIIVFRYASNKVICYIFDNVEDVKKICFSIQKHVCYGCTLGKMYQYNFSENSICFSKPLGLIHLDLLELPILSYLKCKWVITFLDNYSSYCNITFLCKKFETVEAVKFILQIWSNTTFHHVKILYTDNEREHVISELQFFLREQEIIYKTSTLYVH